MARLSLRILCMALLLSLAVPALAGPPAKPSTPPVVRTPSVKDSPGYVPLNDPDSLAEKLGRRPTAKLVSLPFTGGARSLDALGAAVCKALHSAKAESLLALCVTEQEFNVILWPEFPQSRPATGLSAPDAWTVLYGRLNGGSVAASRDLSGHVYTFLRIERTADTKVYKNFKLHNGITIVAKDDTGAIQRFTFIRSVAERKGRFKLYSMRD
jgi:hypothetical protein